MPTITIHPSSGGQRRFTVTSTDPVVDADWCDNPQIPPQSDQSWRLRVYHRIESRGYVASLAGSGQWSNRGDHGRYIGTGPTAEAALRDAWDARYDDDVADTYDPADHPGYSDIPRSLTRECRDYDA